MRILYICVYVSFLFSSEIYKEINIENIPNSTLKFLSVIGVDIDHIYQGDDFIQFAISQHDLEKLDLYNVDYNIIHEDLEQFYSSRLDNSYQSRDFELGSMGGYYTYDEIINRLSDINNQYPDLTELIFLGNSLEGRDIWAIKLSDNANIDENEPEALYTGLHHAREPMSYMNLFYFMDWLLENYEFDNLATHLINNRELWFIPAINPDGLVYNQTIAPNGGGMQRKNMLNTCNNGVDGVDLNRNYSYMWAYDNEGSSPDGCDETYRGNSPFSEPETQIVRDFVLEHDFPIAFNYHSYSNLLIYPLGYEYDNPAPQDDLDIMIEYGEDMVQFNGYALGSGPDLLYPVNGEACDWMYGELGIFAYTPEIGNYNDGFWPQTSRIIPLAEENLYPNQFLGLVTGSKYVVSANLSSDSFVQNELYPLNISIFNQGLGDSNGSVYINIESSDNVVFELENINLNNLSSRETIDLGDITYFFINSASGTLENIRVNVYDDDGYEYYSEIEFLTGESQILINEDFESNNDWTVGAFDDLAQDGIWELGVPNSTFDENNNLVQTGTDHSENGLNCYFTGNGDNPYSPGQSDVDGGKTTLFSPVYDLSEYSAALISYWKWYTNNQGNNPNSDYWIVQVTNDGENWVDLENTNESFNFWKNEQFILNEYVSLTNQIQFKFIADDSYYEGDNGSGGSLIEAALDDFLIKVFTDNEDECPIGDLNEDGLFNVLDVVVMVTLVLGPIDEWDIYLCLADMNGDEQLNVQDIVILVNLILN
ncbi:MAG: hypothetical protein CMG64_05080 [Candidatus Marinimicrobia bacterium]|nr:hypothetical protein [Candidatus Neomarinimicrobiota bacterium]